MCEKEERLEVGLSLNSKQEVLEQIYFRSSESRLAGLGVQSCNPSLGWLNLEEDCRFKAILGCPVLGKKKLRGKKVKTSLVVVLICLITSPVSAVTAQAFKCLTSLPVQCTLPPPDVTHGGEQVPPER